MTLQPSEEIIFVEIKIIKRERDELEWKKNVTWAQKSWQDWLKDDDKNTIFFPLKGWLQEASQFN